MTAPEPTFTLIPYLYRDGDNYKSTGVLLADGAITETQVAAMRDVLDVDDRFIPAQLGLPHLGVGMIGFPDDSDHTWHELGVDEITTSTDARPSEVIEVGDITVFVDRFVAAGAQGWDDTKDIDDWD